MADVMSKLQETLQGMDPALREKFLQQFEANLDGLIDKTNLDVQQTGQGQEAMARRGAIDEMKAKAQPVTAPDGVKIPTLNDSHARVIADTYSRRHGKSLNQSELWHSATQELMAEWNQAGEGVADG